MIYFVGGGAFCDTSTAWYECIICTVVNLALVSKHQRVFALLMYVSYNVLRQVTCFSPYRLDVNLQEDLCPDDGENLFQRNIEEYDLATDTRKEMSTTNVSYGRCRFGYVSLCVQPKLAPCACRQSKRLARVNKVSGLCVSPK